MGNTHTSLSSEPLRHHLVTLKHDLEETIESMELKNCVVMCWTIDDVSAQPITPPWDCGICLFFSVRYAKLVYEDGTHSTTLSRNFPSFVCSFHRGDAIDAKIVAVILFRDLTSNTILEGLKNPFVRAWHHVYWKKDR